MKPGFFVNFSVKIYKLIPNIQYYHLYDKQVIRNAIWSVNNTPQVKLTFINCSASRNLAAASLPTGVCASDIIMWASYHDRICLSKKPSHNFCTLSHLSPTFTPRHYRCNHSIIYTDYTSHIQMWIIRVYVWLFHLAGTWNVYTQWNLWVFCLSL